MLLEKSTLKKTNIFQAYFLRNLTLTTKTQLLETELLIAKQCAQCAHIPKPYDCRLSLFF